MKGDFKCPCCGQGDVVPKIKGKIRMMERILGIDLVVTSGYRCAEHNREVGGVEGSKHLTGHAVDFYIPGWPRHEAREFVAPYFNYTKDFQGVKSWALHAQINEEIP